ncbi:succinate-semialdehyde dehydrogenase / glutarate-semialdehyde dehydrogenase [Salinibacillus kushneri]|uniref:Succinate-semialdehyde dehydrogenase / glutarate-semialdehyde dehydrogenase n=1 Tax=Salinibacillus kushneri TaxID=237682 RepID=A0A1I0CSB8_9BACI|nr:NAD-dependent succinate-semialdehyde dehydrogenase [Salinibacillus kushneri]SET22242.1 succinate-semialdehyde dehydrogenase / glutarate-semialdehyde dehydrogenase [Salinibacillus kushneri]
MVRYDSSIQSIFVDGKWCSAYSNQTEAVYNPATLEAITEVSYGGQKETIEAVKAAKMAFPEWSELSPRKRSNILYKASEYMLEDVDRLGTILTMEQGKPLKEAKGEVKGAASFLRWYAEEANRLYGEWIPSSNTRNRLLVIPQPIGVVGAITPWNFPSSMITRKIGPALAAGCTVVLKPAPETPLSAIEIIKILEKAGIPKGVVNLVTGNAEEIGREFLSNKDVRMITFTGSTKVGKYLMKESAEHVKKVSLELGGHAPILVFDDADLDVAAELTLGSKFRNSGQTCICANRVYVQSSIWEAFNEKLTEKVKELKLGNGLDDGTTMGPLINQQAIEKAEDHLKDATSKGAEVLFEGEKQKNDLQGYFYPPTVLGNVSGDMKVMNEETFGPIIPLQPFDDEKTAMNWANDTDYGLAAYIFTENYRRSVRVSEKLEYGIVGINEVFPARAEAPFGGIKQSGIGKEGGHYGIEEFVEHKYIASSI